MKHRAILPQILLVISLMSCNDRSSAPSKDSISQLNLKRGEIISCGNQDHKFGIAHFEITGDTSVQDDFDLAVELLHSFEYEESEKAFAKIIDEQPKCAMAYWGVAMSNFHPLWSPPTEAELQKGARAIAIARSINTKTKREAAYIDAIGLYYSDWDKTDHHTRCVQFENAMEELHNDYPDDMEASIFYALALDAAAEPTDKTYARQKKAGDILTALYAKYPDHPGIIHYIIHTYDYPVLAQQGLAAARRYAGVAPSSAHALHMPSHIFTRLGLWDECIQSNLQSVAAAQCYAGSAGIHGHWDEELHGLDYVVYAYLQKNEDRLAWQQVQYVNNIDTVSPLNFKVAYCFAAAPSRYVLENKNWTDAAALPLHPNFAWNKFPWQEAIVHFARLLGFAHTNNMTAAKAELDKLNVLHDTLQRQKDRYSANQVAVQIKAGEAWIDFLSGDKNKGLQLMQLAAAMEDSTEKHPVTPGEVLPARELLADMYLDANENENALQAYEAVLQRSPRRYNSVNGAAIASKKMADKQKAEYYMKQLSAITARSNKQDM